jgi:predicted nucleic acid-binding protein
VTYLDTSALIKRFVAEAGSVALQRLIGRSGPVATATIAYPEAYSGLTRRHREGGLSSAQYAAACQRFERDWSELVRVELVDEVLARTRVLIQLHSLRGFDAIHLASALTLQERLGEPVSVVAADERLLRSAAREHLKTLNIETGHGRPGTSR